MLEVKFWQNNEALSFCISSESNACLILSIILNFNIASFDLTFVRFVILEESLNR